MAKLSSDDQTSLKLMEASMVAGPASPRLGAANWVCHSCPPTVYGALFFTGGLWQLFRAYNSPCNTWELLWSPSGTCKTFVLPNCTGERWREKLGLMDQGKGLVTEKWALINEVQRNTEDIRSENFKQSDKRKRFSKYKEGLGKKLNSSHVSSLHSDFYFFLFIFFFTLQKQGVGSVCSRGKLRFSGCRLCGVHVGCRGHRGKTPPIERHYSAHRA